jgi:hypothetical protein
MSTRCGSLDPGVLLYLIQERHMSAEDVSELLYEPSGWLGVSGISGVWRCCCGARTLGRGKPSICSSYRELRAWRGCAFHPIKMRRIVPTLQVGRPREPRRRDRPGQRSVQWSPACIFRSVMGTSCWLAHAEEEL